MENGEPRELEGTLSVFGHDDTGARVTVLPRSTGWRAVRAGGLVLAGLLAAPVVALLPPHVAWAMGAALTGIFLGARKWAERYTAVSLEGPCPRCAAPLGLGGATRLRNPWTVDCEECHHGITLTIPEEALEG